MRCRGAKEGSDNGGLRPCFERLESLDESTAEAEAGLEMFRQESAVVGLFERPHTDAEVPASVPGLPDYFGVGRLGDELITAFGAQVVERFEEVPALVKGVALFFE